MIGLLRGVAHTNESNLIIDVSGVGYQVEVGQSLLSKVSSSSSSNRAEDGAASSTAGGAELTLHIYTHVREDRIELYGFEKIEEKKLFQVLLAVSGVGPKTALAITDRGAAQISQAVQEADVKFFSAVPRVGKRMAQKIIIELKPKLGSLKELELGPIDPGRAEAFAALESLGFDEQSAREALDQIDENTPVAEMVKLALKRLSS